VSGGNRLVVSAEGLGLSFGERVLWDDLSFALASGELLAVLGPNGTGKTSLIRILLGLLAPSAGHVEIEGKPPREARGRVGYVPQQRVFDRDLALRGRDLVRLGVDGHRWGIGRLSSEDRARIGQVLADVGAAEYADAPIGRLSGGEQQRLRVAQALVSDPALLLVDEPLLSLDLAYQLTITHLLDERRRSAGTPIVFVTHDINPVLPMVDRVLYLAPGRWTIGTPDEVLTSETLSALYDTEVDVLRVRGRIIVVGTPDDSHVHHVEHAGNR
jgi:zinc/manganese transport system ATP-binding protein